MKKLKEEEGGEVQGDQGCQKMCISLRKGRKAKKLGHKEKGFYGSGDQGARGRREGQPPMAGTCLGPTDEKGRLRRIFPRREKEAAVK